MVASAEIPSNLEWRYRREAATMRSDRLRRDAEALAEELVLLSQCETD